MGWRKLKCCGFPLVLYVRGSSESDFLQGNSMRSCPLASSPGNASSSVSWRADPGRSFNAFFVHESLPELDIQVEFQLQVWC